MKEQFEYAHAKVNLTLEVLGKRDDGYHELRSIFLPLEFHDFVQVRIKPGNQNITLLSDYSRLNTPKNLMYKAAELFLKSYQLEYDVEIEYTKEIPSQAGLGGGSADAAAVLRALVKMFEMELTQMEIINLCKSIGADVPFCYFNKPALVSGIGDELTFFESNCDLCVVLIKPKKGASTKAIFSALQLRANQSVNFSKKMKMALIENDLEKIKQSVINDLEIATFTLVPEIAKVKQELSENGITPCIMSGSGSTIVCLVNNDHLAQRIVKQYKNRGFFAIYTNFLKEKM